MRKKHQTLRGRQRTARRRTATNHTSVLADLLALFADEDMSLTPQCPQIGPYELATGWAGTGVGKLCPPCNEFIAAPPVIILPSSLSEDLYLHTSCAQQWAKLMLELTDQVQLWQDTLAVPEPTAAPSALPAPLARLLEAQQTGPAYLGDSRIAAAQAARHLWWGWQAAKVGQPLWCILSSYAENPHPDHYREGGWLIVQGYRAYGNY